MVERNYDREVAVDVLVEEAVDGAALSMESPPRWRSLSHPGKRPTAMVREPVRRMPGRNQDAGYQIVERIEGALHAALLVTDDGACRCTAERNNLDPAAPPSSRRWRVGGRRRLVARELGMASDARIRGWPAARGPGGGRRRADPRVGGGKLEEGGHW